MLENITETNHIDTEYLQYSPILFSLKIEKVQEHSSCLKVFLVPLPSFFSTDSFSSVLQYKIPFPNLLCSFDSKACNQNHIVTCMSFFKLNPFLVKDTFGYILSRQSKRNLHETVCRQIQESLCRIFVYFIDI